MSKIELINATNLKDYWGREVTGIVGKDEAPSARVNIVASYGSVKLY
jgi:hypothetical protein